MQVSLDATPAGTALTFIVEVYGQYAPLTVTLEAATIRLTTATQTHTTLPSIVQALLSTQTGPGPLLVPGNEPDQRAVDSYLARLESGELLKDLPALDKDLESKTYLVGSKLSSADLAIFGALHAYIAQASRETLLSHPSITRHFNLIQSLPLNKAALEKGTTFVPAQVKIDVDDVPTILRVAEVKVKKTSAATAAAATVETVPVPAAVEAVVEGKKEKKDKAQAAAAGVEGGEPVKKVKEKKPKPVVVPVVEAAPAPWMIDLRVGKIIDVKLHPDADSLYVETIDVGEAEPRTVVSGLVNYIPIEQMRGRTLITVCNLKPANMRGVKSFAMVLCASSAEGKSAGIEFVDPPAGSVPGDRVYFEGFEEEKALELLNPKKKIFETVQPGFTTLASKEAAWVNAEGKQFKIITAKGVCAVPTFIGASLS